MEYTDEDMIEATHLWCLTTLTEIHDNERTMELTEVDYYYKNLCLAVVHLYASSKRSEESTRH